MSLKSESEATYIACLSLSLSFDELPSAEADQHYHGLRRECSCAARHSGSLQGATHHVKAHGDFALRSWSISLQHVREVEHREGREHAVDKKTVRK